MVNFTNDLPARDLSMSDVKNVQIVSADNWYFVHYEGGPNKPTVHQVAVWALDSNGVTTGLIGGVEIGPGSVSPQIRLVGLPPVKGVFKHLNDLSAAERVCANLEKMA